MHIRELTEWKLDDLLSQVVETVKNSGLSSLVYTYKHVDYVTISAFTERWHPETNSFHTPFEAFKISLDDVAQILKVSVVGHSIYREEDELTEVDLVMEYFGVTDEVAREELNHSSFVKLSFLLDGFNKISKKEETSKNDYEIIARTCLLYLLGYTLFCDKFDTKVLANYLKCLSNVHSLSK